MEIHILRLGHRLPRDERISTHVALVARAFGANSMIYSGQEDTGLEDSMKRISKNWGGTFSVIYEKSPLKIIKKYKKDGYKIIHLTMYGMPLQEKLSKIKKYAKMLIVVGSEKVPSEVYQLSDFNISIGNQPHSEVAALAITLDRINNGKQPDFKGRISITPSERGKDIKEL